MGKIQSLGEGHLRQRQRFHKFGDVAYLIVFFYT